MQASNQNTNTNTNSAIRILTNGVSDHYIAEIKTTQQNFQPAKSTHFIFVVDVSASMDNRVNFNTDPTPAYPHHHNHHNHQQNQNQTNVNSISPSQSQSFTSAPQTPQTPPTPQTPDTVPCWNRAAPQPIPASPELDHYFANPSDPYASDFTSPPRTPSPTNRPHRQSPPPAPMRPTRHNLTQDYYPEPVPEPAALHIHTDSQSQSHGQSQSQSLSQNHSDNLSQPIMPYLDSGMSEYNRDDSPAFEQSCLNYVTKTLGGCLDVISEQPSQCTHTHTNAQHPTHPQSHPTHYTSVITFSDFATTIASHVPATELYQKAPEIIQTIRQQEGGRTNFQAAFEMAASVSLRNIAQPTRQQPAIDEVVIFLTDGNITKGTEESYELAEIASTFDAHWHFIGIGLDYGYKTILEIKKELMAPSQPAPSQPHQPHHYQPQHHHPHLHQNPDPYAPDYQHIPSITSDFLYTLDAIQTVCADILTPYLSPAAYQCGFQSVTTPRAHHTKLLFPDTTTGQTTSDSIHLGTLSSNTTYYVHFKCISGEHHHPNHSSPFYLHYSELPATTANSAIAATTATASPAPHNPFSSPANEPITHTISSYNAVNVSNNADDLALFNALLVRSKTLAYVGKAQQTIETLVLGASPRSTPDSVTIHEDVQQMKAYRQDISNELGSYQAHTTTTTTQHATTTNSTPSSTRTKALHILRQCIDDMTFTIKACENIISPFAGNGEIECMAVHARFTSQMYQRSFTLNDINFLAQPQVHSHFDTHYHSQSQSHSYSQHQQFTSPVSQRLTFDNANQLQSSSFRSPYMSNRVQTMSQTIHMNSQHY